MDNNAGYIIPDSLVAENIFLSFGRKHILKGVTIRADRGKITGLLGRNGTGKTTMLQSIFGTGSAQECDVFLNGAKIRQPYAVKNLINYLPQKPFLPQGLRFNDAARRFGVDISYVLDAFPELEIEYTRRVADLSGGTERLFSVLIILLANTRFSLLDEPFTHIMPLHVDNLKTLISRQKDKKGIIITDHLYDPLLSISDQVYLMKDGKSLLIRDMGDLVLHGYISNSFDRVNSYLPE